MAMDVYFSPLTEKYEYLLPGITKAAEAALWFPYYAEGLLVEEIVLLTQVLDGLRPIISVTKADPYNNKPLELRDRIRVFGNVAAFDQKVVAQNTLQYQDSDDKIYSDVAWVPIEGFPDGGAYIRDFVSFIPDTKEAVKNWANIFYGINWLKTCRYWNYRNPTPLDLTEVQPAIFLSYVKLTQKIGGIPGFVCNAIDTEARSILVLLGSEAYLRKVALRLSEHCNSISDEEFSWWFNRGIYLPYYPGNEII